MKSATAYGIAMAPLAVWLLLTHATYAALDRLSEERMLSATEEWVSTCSRWGIRATDPLVVMACVTVIPLSMLAASCLWPRLLADGAEPRTVLRWVLVAAGSWSVAVIAIWLLLSHERTLLAQVVVPLAVWSGGLANALAVSTGTITQARLGREGYSRMSSWAVLLAGVALQVMLVVPAFLVGLVPMFASRWHVRRRPAG